MVDLDRMAEQVNWLVSAVKMLMEEEFSPRVVPTLPGEYDEVAEFYGEPVNDPIPEIVVRPKVCPHNHQTYIPGKGVVCALCSAVVNKAGVYGRDPNAPKAGEDTREASSKNPGIPLVPHSS